MTFSDNMSKYLSYFLYKHFIDFSPVIVYTY